MPLFKPCAGKSACRDDNVTCLVCGRDLQAIAETRRLIDSLAELALAQGYENVEAYADYVAGKVAKKVHHRRNGSPSAD